MAFKDSATDGSHKFNSYKVLDRVGINMPTHSGCNADETEGVTDGHGPDLEAKPPSNEP
jgi:hypothetical protein